MPLDPAGAILLGLERMEVEPATALVHGSTVATNALLERSGARTALVTTAGFGDVLAIGRQDRLELYALVPRNPEPLVPSALRFEVNERVTAEGVVLQPVEAESLAEVVEKLVAEQVESVAVCLLFSFLQPDHERKVRAAIVAQLENKRPMHISLSSEILPEFREYERSATTVINAYVAPMMNRYLDRLEREVAPRSLAVMQSNGGIISAKRAGREAARTVLSGPAGGVVGARHVAGLAGYQDIITFDMGGTSTDVALCPGDLPTTVEGQIAGFPLRLPIIDIHTVGAGGGSLASVDPGGALQVGPASAGSVPGPACYGGESTPVPDLTKRTTVTDANLVLGRLDPGRFLGGKMRLDESAARNVMMRLAESLEVETAERAAWGVIQVANANMERAIRRISVERGYDPRFFTLVAFGGAGPLHACELAAGMQIPRVLIPPSPGVLSALGMLVADPARDYSATVMERLAAGQMAEGTEGALEWLEERFRAMRSQAVKEMGAEGFGPGELIMTERLDVRYQGQSHELTVPAGADHSALEITSAFHEAHRDRYGFIWPEKAVQIVNVRLNVTAGRKPPVGRKPPAGPQLARGKADSSAAIIGRRRAWFGVEAVESQMIDRDRLMAGNRFSGPAVVFQYDTTSVIPPDWTAEVDDQGNLLLVRNH